MKRILIIGHQGYLGSYLCPYLTNIGYDVSGIDIGYFEHGVVHPINDYTIAKKGAQFITKNELRGFDAVIQLAGISNDPVDKLDPDLFYKTCVTYTAQIASYCRDLGIKFIFPSSCSVYGISEDNLDETSAVDPKTHYSKSKIDIEKELQLLSGPDFSPFALRLATVFGPSPRIRFDVVINMLSGMAAAKDQIILNSNGQAWRPHLFIEDACHAMERCLQWDYNEPELMILNVGRNDNNWKIIDVAQYLSKQFTNVPVSFLQQSDAQDSLISDRKITDGIDVRNYQVAFDKIHKILPGFECKNSVPQGIEKLISWLKDYQINEAKFSQREFYRLQQMEFLHAIDALIE